MPASRFRYHGDLAQEPLPEILQTIYHYRVPGMVTVSRDEIEKRICLQGGNVIFATSTDRADSLGQFLKTHERISSGELRISRDLLAAAAGKRHGQLLVEMGVLSESELKNLVVQQVCAILYSVFDWDRGLVRFEAGQFRAEEQIQLAIPTAQSILDGIKLMKDPKRAVARLGPSWTVLDRTETVLGAPDLVLTAGEAKLLERVDGVRTLRDLVGLGPGDAGANARLLYAFFVLKLIDRRDVAARSGIRKLQWRTGGSQFGPGDTGA